jgi:hypothetical protein
VRPRDLGSERTARRPRYAILASSRVRGQGAHSAVTGLLGMPESFYPTIQLPELDVVTVYELFGLLDGLGLVLTMQVNAFLNVAIRP